MFRRYDVDLLDFLDKDIFQRTLRVKGRLSREDAIKRLTHAGVNPSDIVGMYREGENSPWSVVLKTRDHAEKVNADGIKYIANFTIDLRIHWLPLYIKDEIIVQVLSPFGKVLDITRQQTILDKDTVTYNGTRLVKFQTTEFECKDIPHIISLGTCGMLITMKGRPPVCLKCRQLGHLRKDCPEKTTTYASVAKKPQPPKPTVVVPDTPNTSTPDPTPGPSATPTKETPQPEEPPPPTADEAPVSPSEEIEVGTCEEDEDDDDPKL
ncbi:hypothetical protein ACJMK2_043184, partial [Sinanodonta woodiana]